MKSWWRKIRPYVLRGVIYWFARLIGMTLRIETPGYEKVKDLPTSKILAAWHGRTFVATTFFRNKGLWTIISLSRDGEMQNHIFRRFGFNTIRGSSSKGGVRAVIQAVKVLRGGEDMAFTPDGPRGPSGVVQPGIMMMAQKSGAAIVPLGVSADRRWLAPTWDKFLVPKPFARVVMLYGDPIYVPADSNEEQVEAIRLRVEQEIHRLESDAMRMTGHDPG